MSQTLYECKAEHCTLGTRGSPGFFTGGISEEMALALSGDPKAAYGDGVCPNCGGKGVKAGKHEVNSDG